ncbi:MAG: hypothetical protein ACHP9T_09220 [Caulobacterales bacterium]|jgi:hypothetical protein
MILALLASATILGPPPTAERTPNLYHEPSYCRSVVEKEVSRQETAFRGAPPPVQYAVLRRLDGCSVPTPVGYHPAYLAGEAAAPASPKRGDAPSNRR